MSKNLRGLTLLLAAVFVMIIMAVPAFAANGMNGRGDGYYMIEDESIPTYSTTDQVKVRIIVQGRYSTDASPIPAVATRTVTLTGSTSYTILDAMLKFNADSTTYKAYNFSTGLPITTATTVLDKFVYGSRTWDYLFFNDIGNGEGRIPVDGWMYRVNGRNPMKEDPDTTNTYPIGAMINETYIKSGDVITFFTNYPFTINSVDYSTKFIAADTKYTAPSGDGTGTLQVQLQESRDNHYDAQGQWTTSSFTDYAPGSTKYAYLYDSNFSYITYFTLDSTGYGTLSRTLSSGTYYLDIGTKTFKSISGYTSRNGNTTGTCSCLDTTAVYDRFVIS